MEKLMKLLVALVFSGGALSVVQEVGANCKNMSYENRNQTDYGPLPVVVVKGSVRDPQGVAIPNLCVGVFTEVGHKLVAGCETNENGDFETKKVPNGNSRLVATYPGFCPANARVRVRQQSRSNTRLTVRMKPAGIDTCSYVEQK